MSTHRHISQSRRDFVVQTFLNLFFSASDGFCRLLTAAANSLETDQARQNVGPDLDLDLDPNCLSL